MQAKCFAAAIAALLSLVELLPCLSQTAPETVTLSRLILAGAETLPAGDRQFLKDAAQAHLCERDRAQSCVENIVKRTLQQRGYFLARASAESLQYPDPQRPQDLVAVVHVVPGKAYQLKEMRFTGVRTLSSEELRQLPQPELGKPLDTEQLHTFIGALRRRYEEKGNREVVVIPDVELDQANSSASVIIHVDEAPAPAAKP
ncbi:MAG TPA: POTRA domain-containing protein [Terriglobales bacterium]|nr:POTRA domain-containing protein [Terriglobales bacterium]